MVLYYHFSSLGVYWVSTGSPGACDVLGVNSNH
jgi:hypothetical protein